MSIKTTGIELKSFWKDDSVWPADSYVDGLYLKVNGQDADSEDIEALNDADQVVIEDGYFCDANDDGESLLTVFKRWRKKQTTVYISASCPKELEEAVRAWQIVPSEIWQLVTTTRATSAAASASTTRT